MAWVMIIISTFLAISPLVYCGHDYGKALSKSILFFEAQRSGYLPKNQRVTWRADSALQDGKANGVGDGNTDHYCWQRPEDMITSRQPYGVDVNHPGSDLAGETAASMASASIIFRRFDPAYSNQLLNHAEQVYI